MDTKLKNKWVKALRSGNYHQSKDGGALCRVQPENPENARGEPGYCCLGVLIEERHGEGAWCESTEDDGELLFDGKHGFLSNSELKIINMKIYDMHKVAGMNDSGKTFMEIADYIEENLL